MAGSLAGAGGAPGAGRLTAAGRSTRRPTPLTIAPHQPEDHGKDRGRRPPPRHRGHWGRSPVLGHEDAHQDPGDEAQRGCGPGPLSRARAPCRVPGTAAWQREPRGPRSRPAVPWVRPACCRCRSGNFPHPAAAPPFSPEHRHSGQSRPTRHALQDTRNHTQTRWSLLMILPRPMAGPEPTEWALPGEALTARRSPQANHPRAVRLK